MAQAEKSPPIAMRVFVQSGIMHNSHSCGAVGEYGQCKALTPRWEDARPLLSFCRRTYCKFLTAPHDKLRTQVVIFDSVCVLDHFFMLGVNKPVVRYLCSLDPAMARQRKVDLHTRRVSIADYPPRPHNATEVDFYFRHAGSKTFHQATLSDAETARSTMRRMLSYISIATTRIVILIDEVRPDMPVVNLDELERIVREETVLGKGHKTQIFVVVYDTDPMTDPTPNASEISVVLSRRPHERRRSRNPEESCCGIQ